MSCTCSNANNFQYHSYDYIWQRYKLFDDVYYANYAKISVTTAMFNGLAGHIRSGFLNAKYIIISDSSKITLGDDFKITGDVYLVTNEDYNNIWWTWTNNSMLKYIEEHKLKPVHYESENFSSHYAELTSTNESNKELVQQPETAAEVDA